MAKEMLINVSEGEECRIALMENGKLDEFYIERTSFTSHVGNIYKGRVVNVEASIQAAFIDFGLGRNGFLHISDLQPTYFGRRGDEQMVERVGCKIARRDRPPIQRCLRRGDDILVQIIKEGLGTKGPTLTTYLSIPGRMIVMMPGMAKMGVSRKIEDEPERRRLRQILDSLKPPKDCGFIIRTAGVGKTKIEIQRDLAYLTRLWQNIEKKLALPAPQELYTEGDLVTRTVRDVFTPEVESIIVDDENVAKRVKEFIKLNSPRTKNKVELYVDPIPLFHKYKIEKEVEQVYSRHVPLPSGGSIVLDQTEAVVAIDVNSGKFRDHSDPETTAFKTDMEAADEICRQLRLRDMGGVIICDFIDLRYDRHRRELEERLHHLFQQDRAKTKVLRMSQFGIVEITRQRMRPSVKRSMYCDCLHCHGSGQVKTPESMSLDIMRRLTIAAYDQRVERIELTVHNEVALYLNNRKRRQLAALEDASGKQLVVRADDSLGMDQFKLAFFDSRDGIVLLPDLIPAPLTSLQAAMEGGKAPERQGGRRGAQRGRDRRGGSRPPAGVDNELVEIDEMEDDLDAREDQEEGGFAEEPLPQARPPQEMSDQEAPGPDMEDASQENVPEEEGDADHILGPAPEGMDDEYDRGRRPQRSGRPPLPPRGGQMQQGSQGRRDDRRPQQGNQPQRQGQMPPRGPMPMPPRGQQPPRGPQPQPQRQGQPQPVGQGPRPGTFPQGAPMARGPVGTLHGGQMPPRVTPPVQGAQPPRGDLREGDEFQDNQRRGRRRRGRRGRGRGVDRYERPVNQPNQPNQPVQPHLAPDMGEREPDGNRLRPEDRDRDIVSRLPSNVWIEVPTAPTVPPSEPWTQSEAPQVEQSPAAQPEPTPASAMPVDVPAVQVELTPPAPAEEPPSVEPPAKKPRRKAAAPRAARPGSRKKAAAEAAAPGEETPAAKPARRTTASRTKAAVASSQPRVRIAPIADALPVIPAKPAGDRHLIAEEPVHTEPVTRPSTRRDLDQIPEDLD